MNDISIAVHKVWWYIYYDGKDLCCLRLVIRSRPASFNSNVACFSVEADGTAKMCSLWHNAGLSQLIPVLQRQ